MVPLVGDKDVQLSHLPSSPGSFRLGYRPALDGFRAISILMVMSFHSNYVSVTPGGFIGVDIFFVLSGFLITSLLLEEHKLTGSIDLLAFYIRRTLRLLPAVLILLACMWIAIALIGRYFKTDYSLMLVATFAVIFYLTNWVLVLELSNGWPAALGHLWSLAIEEQFYLVWPILLRFALAKKLSRHLILVFVGSCVVAVGLWRAYLWDTTHSYSRCYFATDTRADAILVGCAIGLMASAGWLKRMPIVSIFSMLFLITTCLLANNTAGYMFYGGYSLIALAVGTLIVEILFSPPKFLTLAPFIWIGRLSYGLYLWHFPVYHLITKSPLKDHLKDYPLAGLSAEFALTFLCASLSFYLAERPVLKLKHRFERRSPPKSADKIG